MLPAYLRFIVENHVQQGTVDFMARNTQWTPSNAPEGFRKRFAEKMDSDHAYMRVGIWMERMETWLQTNQDATNEQIRASAERWANLVGDPEMYKWRNLFKRNSRETQLNVRTDLRLI